MRYTTDEYFDVEVCREENGFRVSLKKRMFSEPVSHYPEENDFPDKLYQDFWEKAYAWGVLKQSGELIACIETCPEEWSNRLMVTELWVHEDYRRHGIAHALMAVAKEQARLERRRALILETQSCNVGAISFYLSEGFTLIGFDSCCYNNRDLERREVRLDLGILLDRKPALKRDEVEIRPEREADYHATEEMTMRAFWNRYHGGCNEHLLVHKLRRAEEYLPEISRILVKEGKVIGCIMYSRAWLKKDGKTKEILTFGPLCVDPDWQGAGVGKMLLEETMELAGKAGYSGIVIFGEPDYYPLRGQPSCRRDGGVYEEVCPPCKNSLFPGSGIKTILFLYKIYLTFSPGKHRINLEIDKNEITITAADHLEIKQPSHGRSLWFNILEKGGMLMSDNELLLAISDMMDRKLKPIHADIRELQEDMAEVKADIAELKTDVAELKIEVRELQEDMAEVKADIIELQTAVGVMQTVVGAMQTSMKKMQIQMETDFSPRLQNIESCYLSTYQRYSKGTEQIDSMQMDIDVLKSTVIEHSEKLQRIS